MHTQSDSSVARFANIPPIMISLCEKITPMLVLLALLLLLRLTESAKESERDRRCRYSVINEPNRFKKRKKHAQKSRKRRRSSHRETAAGHNRNSTCFIICLHRYFMPRKSTFPFVFPHFSSLPLLHSEFGQQQQHQDNKSEQIGM